MFICFFSFVSLLLEEQPYLPQTNRAFNSHCFLSLPPSPTPLLTSPPGCSSPPQTDQSASSSSTPTPNTTTSRSRCRTTSQRTVLTSLSHLMDSWRTNLPLSSSVETWLTSSWRKLTWLLALSQTRWHQRSMFTFTKVKFIRCCCWSWVKMWQQGTRCARSWVSVSTSCTVFLIKAIDKNIPCSSL